MNLWTPHLIFWALSAPVWGWVLRKRGVVVTRDPSTNCTQWSLLYFPFPTYCRVKKPCSQLHCWTHRLVLLSHNGPWPCGAPSQSKSSPCSCLPQWVFRRRSKRPLLYSRVSACLSSDGCRNQRQKEGAVTDLTQFLPSSSHWPLSRASTWKFTSLLRNTPLSQTCLGGSRWPGRYPLTTLTQM